MSVLGDVYSQTKEEKRELDKFGFMGNIGTSLYYTKITETVANAKGETIIQGKIVDLDPTYSFETNRYFNINIDITGGLHIPLYRSKKWGLGIEANIGIRGVKELNTWYNEAYLTFIAPCRLYFRKNEMDYFVGYMTVVDPLVGTQSIFKVGATLHEMFQFYITPFRKTYYTELSNGDLKPTLKYFELGVSFMGITGR